MTDPDGKIDQPRHGWQDKDGLTKRELFAAMAMQSMVAAGKIPPEIPPGDKSRKWLAISACLIADTLIAELNKDNKT